MHDLIAHVASSASRIAVSEGCELVHVCYTPASGRGTLQVFVDRPEGGPTVEHCARISRQLSGVLEEYDLMPGPYRLEVSSPGINRPLKTHDPHLTRASFVRFAGRLAVIKTSRPLPIGLTGPGAGDAAHVGGRKTWKGYLQGMEGDHVLIQVDGLLTHVPVECIKKAYLEFEF